MLDDAAARAAADPSDMLGAVEAWATQWRDAMQRADAIPPIDAASSAAVVCGMGGSGIAGDVARALIEPACPIPVRLVRGHEIPGFVREGTLVVCVSYSGNTSETLACFDQALERGAHAIAISAGGELGRRAEEAGALWVRPVPGLSMPRAALPALTVPLLTVLDRAGIVTSADTIEHCAGHAERCVDAWRRGVPLQRNRAKQIATAIGSRLPLIWGSEGTQTVAALRWKAQLAENAKVPASASMLPELCHNDIVGLEHGHAALADAILVVLRVEGGHPGQDARLKAAVDLVQDSVGAVEIVAVGGATPAERLVESMILGDFVSVYLAMLRGVDPTPIHAIARLKAALE